MAIKIRQSPSDRVFDVIVIVLMTLLMLLVLYPLVFIVSASVSNPDMVNQGKVWLFPVGFTLEGYYRVFQDAEILIGYRNTFFYTIAGTILNLALTLTAAFSLSKKDLAGRNVIMFFIAFTMYFSGGMIPSYLLMKNLGLINSWLVLIVSSGISTYNLIISRTFFQNGVPQDIEEAAFIDGCSPVRALVSIVLPLSKALIGVMALYYGVSHWNSYFSALIYVTDRSKIPLQLVLREILIEQQMKGIDGMDYMSSTSDSGA